MKKKNEISPDELFANALSGYQAEFDSSAWEKMKVLLDEDDLKTPVLIVPPSINKKPSLLKLLIIMITSTILGISSILFMHSITGPDNNTADPRPVQEQKTLQDVNPSAEQKLNTGLLNSEYRSNNEYSIARAYSVNNTNSGIFGSDTPQIEKPASFIDSQFTVFNNGKHYRVLNRKVWVPETYEYIEKPGNKSIDDGFIGIHFTAQRFRQTDSFSHGLNVQFMSGNRMRNSNWGLYGGFDWGMQFYNKSRKMNVVLNNTNQDSGYTRLRTFSMDFLGRMHFEYAKFQLIPYVNFMAGPRLYATDQIVSSYIPMKETESRTSTNVHTSVSMMYGFGFGLRMRISPVVSLDARYEWMNGSPVKLVDLNKSTFGGLNYNLAVNKIALHQEQFKFGILFNLSDVEYDKKLVKEGYYRNYSLDSLEINASDSNKIIIPCNCEPCPTESYTKEYHPSSNESEPFEGTSSKGHNPGSSGGSSNSGSSGKKSFPGIKPPSKPTEIRR